MRSRFLLLALVFVLSLAGTAYAQTAWNEAQSKGKGELLVNYFENYPFCYTDTEGNLTGIEVDILQEFINWVKVNKKVEIATRYVGFKDFKEFTNSIKTAANGTLGAGSVTITRDRAREFRFSPPYLRNISVLISGISVPTLNGYSEISSVFEGMAACVIKGSVAEKELLEIKKFHFPSMLVKYVQNPTDITNTIAREPKKFFGYSDIISYWVFTKQNGGVLKMHKVANRDNEKFGFIMPLSSDWTAVFSEFFEGGFGFTSNVKYREILERHLGYEIIRTVELN